MNIVLINIYTYINSIHVFILTITYSKESFKQKFKTCCIEWTHDSVFPVTTVSYWYKIYYLSQA